MREVAIGEALSRIEMEFSAMPGLRLTAAQVNRLIDLPLDVCDSALHVLIRTGFLKLTEGEFLRRGPAEVRRYVVA